MNNLFARLSVAWTLRLGLGAMYLYSGLDLFRHPTAWQWAIRPIPEFVKSILINPLGIDNFLKFQGLGEIVLALFLLGWFFPRWTLKLAAFLSAVEMILILWMTGIDTITFRDIGLLGASFSLLILAYQKNQNVV